MRKHQSALIAAALIGAVMVPQVSVSATLLKRVEYKDFEYKGLEYKGLEYKDLESFLPPVTADVPWLSLDRRTKLPKGDYPIGRDSPGPTTLQFPPINQHADLAEFALGGS
jgi:hypothetical protein